MASSAFSLDLGLRGTHVLVTGGAGLIGSVVVSAFLAAGANVSSLDLSHPSEGSPKPQVHAQSAEGSLLDLHVDISDKASLTTAWEAAVKAFGPVECCVALASLDLSVLPQTESICDMEQATWQKVLNVNVNGTFLTAQLWLRGIREAVKNPSAAASLKNVNLIIMGSESGHFGARTQAAYAAGKSAVQGGLLQSLRGDVPRIYAKARVNAVAPGAVDTARFKKECEDFGPNFRYVECEATTALAVPIPPSSVARTIVFLASETWSGHTHGQILNVDSGTIGHVVWSKEEMAQRHANETRIGS